MHNFPPERKRIDIGDYFADDKLFRDVTGWRPIISMSEGLARSVDYFRMHLAHYV
jgi:UDP-glucose 4-epimerase